MVQWTHLCLIYSLHHIKLLITHLIWIGIYTFSTNYIYLSVTNLTLLQTFQKELLWRKWNDFKAERKEMEVFEISFVVFNSPTVSLIENWLKISNFCLRERKIFYWFSLIARGIWICYKQKCEVSDVARSSQPVWIVHLFFLENVRCPSHCLELKGERSLNPWPGRLNPSITQNRKSRGIWSRSLRLSLTKKEGQHIWIKQVWETSANSGKRMHEDCLVWWSLWSCEKRLDFWLLVGNQVNWQNTKLRLNFTSIDR